MSVYPLSLFAKRREITQNTRLARYNYISINFLITMISFVHLPHTFVTTLCVERVLANLTLLQYC